MAKRKSGTRTGTSRARHTHDPRSVPALRRAWPRTLLDGLIHSAEPDQPRWKLVPLLLALAFAVRAAVALAGDFVLHPDEIMQYLEPAHRLAFGNGVVYWVLLRGALLAGAGRGGRRAQAVRCSGARRAVVVRRRRQAIVLRHLAGDPSRHVQLRPPPLQRDRGAAGPARRRLLVRTGRLRAQAADRVRGDRAAAWIAGPVRKPLARPSARGLAGGPRWLYWSRRSGCNTPPWHWCCSQSCSCVPG